MASAFSPATPQHTRPAPVRDRPAPCGSPSGVAPPACAFLPLQAALLHLPRNSDICAQVLNMRTGPAGPQPTCAALPGRLHSRPEPAAPEEGAGARRRGPSARRKVGEWTARRSPSGQGRHQAAGHWPGWWTAVWMSRTGSGSPGVPVEQPPARAAAAPPPPARPCPQTWSSPAPAARRKSAAPPRRLDRGRRGAERCTFLCEPRRWDPGAARTAGGVDAGRAHPPTAARLPPLRWTRSEHRPERRRWACLSTPPKILRPAVTSYGGLCGA